MSRLAFAVEPCPSRSPTPSGRTTTVTSSVKLATRTTEFRRPSPTARSATSLVLGLSLALASLVGSAWTFHREVLDPTRSEELAVRILAAPDVREQLAEETAGGLVQLALPDQLTDLDGLDRAVDAMLASEDLASRIKDRFVSAHQLGINGEREEPFIDDRDLRTTARAVLYQELPGIQLKEPSARRFDMFLPIEGYSILGRLIGPTQWLKSYGLILAGLGIVGSLLVADNRAATCRTAAPWALGSAVGWLLVAGAFRLVSAAATPVPFRAVGETLNAGLSTVAGPATVVALAGVGLLAVGALWPALQRRRGAALLARTGAAAD